MITNATSIADFTSFIGDFFDLNFNLCLFYWQKFRHGVNRPLIKVKCKITIKSDFWIKSEFVSSSCCLLGTDSCDVFRHSVCLQKIRLISKLPIRLRYSQWTI